MTNPTRRKFITYGLTVPLAVTLAGPALAATTHDVQIKKFKFRPANLKIKAGDSVRFTNLDGAPHTADANGGSFKTGKLKKGQSATITFSGKGNFDYFCKFHPNMKGSIKVG